jgi:hypothetical protein
MKTEEEKAIEVLEAIKEDIILKIKAYDVVIDSLKSELNQSETLQQ